MAKVVMFAVVLWCGRARADGMTYIDAMRERLTITNLTTRAVFHETSILVNYLPETRDFYLSVEGGDCGIAGSLVTGIKAIHQAATEIAVDHVQKEKDNVFDGDGGDDVIEPEDLYHIKLNVSVPGTMGRTIVGFTAVRPSKESQFKFMPFCLEDFYYMFQLVSLPRITDAASASILPFNLTIPIQCFQNTSYLHLITHIAQHADELNIHTQNILMTAFFLYISFNPNWNMDEKYEICTTSYNIHRDAPFILDRCCQIQRKHIFQVDREDHNIWCHQANHVRYALGHLVVIVCFIATLFSPLLIKFMPTLERPQ